MAVLTAMSVGSFCQAQSTVSTPVVGFYKVSVPQGSSFQGVNLINNNLFSGVVSNATGSSVTFSANSFNAGSWNQTDGIPETEPSGIPLYYMEVQTGSNAGTIYDIVSNTSNSLILQPAPLNIVGQTVVVRKHMTLSQVAQQMPSLRGNVDSLTIYNANGTQTDVLWDGSNWVDLNAFVYGDLYPIYPGQGFVINAANAVAQTVTGVVKTSPTVVSVYQGAVNVITTMNPSVGSSTTLGSSGLGQFLTANADTLSTFNTVNGQLVVNYDALMWIDGSVWANLNTYEDATLSPLDFSKPVVLSVVNDTICKLPGVNTGN